MLRRASHDDLPQMSELLTSFNLPAVSMAEQIESFVVIEESGQVVGTGGIEYYGRTALLRSLAVTNSHQRRGHAATICEHLEAAAKRRGVEYVYILTETAEEFFVNRGYSKTARAEAPPEIARSEEFSVLCPQSAILMRRAA